MMFLPSTPSKLSHCAPLPRVLFWPFSARRRSTPCGTIIFGRQGAFMAGQALGLEGQGFRNLKAVNWNLTVPELYEHAIARKEGHVAKDGPFVVLTGQHTGRSATDKFVVRDAASENQVWWDNNKPITPAHFDALYAAMFDYAKDRELFIKDAFGGADSTHRLPVRIITELAWHSLFAHQLLI